MATPLGPNAPLSFPETNSALGLPKGVDCTPVPTAIEIDVVSTSPGKKKEGAAKKKKRAPPAKCEACGQKVIKKKVTTKKKAPKKRAGIAKVAKPRAAPRKKKSAEIKKEPDSAL